MERVRMAMWTFVTTGTTIPTTQVVMLDQPGFQTHRLTTTQSMMLMGTGRELLIRCDKLY